MMVVVFFRKKKNYQTITNIHNIVRQRQCSQFETDDEYHSINGNTGKEMSSVIRVWKHHKTDILAQYRLECVVRGYSYS